MKMKTRFSIRSLLAATLLVALFLPSAIASYPWMIGLFNSEPVASEVDRGYKCILVDRDFLNEAAVSE